MGRADDLTATLRRSDHDRYLSTLYAPDAKRTALVALYSFNAEIAAVRDRVREPMAGQVRLKWWSDATADLSGNAAAGNPLAEALAGAIVANRLPVAAFERMLEARVFDLYDDPMPSRTDLEGYLGETASTLIQLAALILDRDAAQSIAEQAGHAGCAQGIAGLLRLMPMHRARGQCYVPAEILTAAGADRESFLAGETGVGDRVVEAMVSLGREHWLAFERGAADMAPSLRPAFLPAALAPAYLDAVARAGGKALERPVDIAFWRRQWIMLRRASSGF
ncbi:MAG: phytoene/squalene synthase family protein [Mesorhizobium sp.]